jgi:hypothetical protein
MAASPVTAATQRPAPRRWRIWLGVLGAGMLATALWHGIYIPVSWAKALAEPALEDRAVSLDMDGAVVSLLPQVRIRLLEARLTSKLTEAPLLHAGLLTLSLRRSTSGETGWVRIEQVEIRRGDIHIVPGDNEGLNWNAWRRVPPRSRQAVALPDNILLQNTSIRIQHATKQTTVLHIDHAKWHKADQQPIALALRFEHPRAKGNLQLQGVSQQIGNSWALISSQMELRGQLDGYPWTGTVAFESLGLGSLLKAASTSEANDASPSEGKPQAISLEHFRVYLRRDDDPDEHQAVFSAARSSFHPSDGRLLIHQGEWTYTHEKAEAWTFDATVDMALHRIDIHPQIIAGSEAIPAQRQHWRWPCDSPQGQTDIRTAWVWQQGWFERRVTGFGGQTGGLLVCSPSRH